MTLIEKFAIEEMGITLLPNQVKLIEMWSRGEQFHSAMRAGWKTARDVMCAYINKGITTEG